MLHSISLSSRTSSTPAISSAAHHNKNKNKNNNSNTSRPSRTSPSRKPSPTSLLPALSPSSTPPIPSSTGTFTSTQTALLPQTSKNNNNCPQTSPALWSQHQHLYPSPSPAGHPFITKNNQHKVRPNLAARRLSSSYSGPSTVPLSSSCPSLSFLSPSINYRSPRLRATAGKLSGTGGVQTGALAATTLSSFTTAATAGPGAALILDERGQPQLLKLSSHHPLPLPVTRSSQSSWLSEGAGNRHQHQKQLRQRQQHYNNHGHDHPTHNPRRHFQVGTECYSKIGHVWIEKNRQATATTTDLQNAISSSPSSTMSTIIDTATLLRVDVIGMPSRSSNAVETEGETEGNQCGGSGDKVRNGREEEQTIVLVEEDDGWNTAKATPRDHPQQLQPTSPLTPIPTDTAFTQSPSSSPPSLLTLLRQQPEQDLFTHNSIHMTPPPRRSSLFGVASSTCSPDQLPGTTIANRNTPTTATTTLPLTAEVIGSTTLMYTPNMDEQRRQEQVIIVHPPTPRSKPKPSPIATKSLLRRANSLCQSTSTNAISSSKSTAAQQEKLGEAESNNTDNCPARPATCGLEGDFLLVSSAAAAAGLRKNGDSSSSDEEEARDSGIVLEPWDHSLPQHKQQEHETICPSEATISVEPEPTTATTKQQQQQPKLSFPSFDELFQPSFDLLDPQTSRRGSSDHQRTHLRRQRCQSMIYPSTPRETELDENGSRSNDDDADPFASLNPSGTTFTNDDNNSVCTPSTTVFKSREQKTRRSKRVASMSIGSGDRYQHSFLGTHGLPPLPPLASSTSGTSNNSNSNTGNSKPQRSSFFCSPSRHDSASDTSANGTSSSSNHSSRDSTARRPSHLPSNDSTSSFSSTTTIPLSRPSSPPDHHSHYQQQPSLVGSFAHGVSFSNMLDLATAKAENITGLYFAKQMNHQAAAGGMIPGAGGNEDDSQGGKKRTRAVTSTGSPTLDFPSNASVSSTGNGCAPPTLVLDGVRIPESPLSATTSFPSTTATTITAQVTPTPPMRGQHRRSHSASHFFHLSSLKHHSPAQFNLALCYEHGQGGVEQDLAKALYFYQQAADQGHTKASYNLGCICYNQGEISKAMAWFESAGKCCVKGLTTAVADATGGESDSLSSTARREGCKSLNGSVLECPMPKATILPHELEDMLMMGEQPTGPDGGASGAGMASGGGPFVAYLPAILCLALLCRQGVQTREGGVVLRRDPDQAIALLQRLLDRAPTRLLNKLEKDHHYRQQQQTSMSNGGRMRDTGKRDPRKRASLQTVPTLQQAAGVTSIFSTSCPQLPLGHSSSSSIASSSSCSVASTATSVRVKRRSTVEDAVDNDDDYESSFCNTESRNRKKATMDPQQISERRQSSFLDSEEDNEEEEEELLHGSDVHEAWSVTLAQQLLKAWQQPSEQGRPTSASTTTPPSTSMEDARIQQRIVRHHLLYITNPTFGKNFYNLGVLYDLYLGNAKIAQRCYRSAYHNCRLLLPPAAPVSVQDTFAQHRQQHQQQQQQLAGLVTRINSAWNLGVLYAKHQEWSRARGWFLKAQQDVHAHERVVASAAAEASKSRVMDRRGQCTSRGGSEVDMVSDLAALLMKQGGGEDEDWSSQVEGLLSLGGSSICATDAKQGRSVSKKSDLQGEDEDESKSRRRSLVNVIPSPGVGQQQSNISAHGREGRRERRGRSGGRDGSRCGSGRNGPSVAVSKDSPGSRHAREHGLMMHLSNAPKARGASKSSKKGIPGLPSRATSEGAGGSDGIRTDASKVAWVLRWVESNMESPSKPTLLSL